MRNNEDIGQEDSFIFIIMKTTKRQENENTQIPLSLTTVSPCKNEWKI